MNFVPVEKLSVLMLKSPDPTDWSETFLKNLFKKKKYLQQWIYQRDHTFGHIFVTDMMKFQPNDHIR